MPKRDSLDALREKTAQADLPLKASATNLVFGDANDPGTEVAARFRDRRFYTVLPELNLRPGVGYLGRVRNADEGGSHRAG